MGSFEILSLPRTPFSELDSELGPKIIAFVDKIKSFPAPKTQLEQYSLPSDLIAFILLLVQKDLKDKNVVDLGCGTGRFLFPISKFFANRTLGVDVDLNVIFFLLQQRPLLSKTIDLLVTPIEFLEPYLWGKRYHVTVMNPPFGTKRRRIDLVFLKQALKYSQIVISLHKSNESTRKLIKQLGQTHNKKMDKLATVSFPIFPHMKFHRKNKHFVSIDIIRLY